MKPPNRKRRAPVRSKDTVKSKTKKADAQNMDNLRTRQDQRLQPNFSKNVAPSVPNYSTAEAESTSSPPPILKLQQPEPSNRNVVPELQLQQAEPAAMPPAGPEYQPSVSQMQHVDPVSVQQSGPKHAWLVGSSIIYWSSRRARVRIGGTDLGLLQKGLRLYWYGTRGLRWESFISTFDKYVKAYPRPDYLIIQAGSNDLGVVTGKELIENIRADILRLSILYPDLEIIWSDILPRRYWHYGNNHSAIEGTRKRLNKAVRKVIKAEISNGYAIGHPNIMEKERTLLVYRNDGTHLSDVGNDIFLNNVQAALESFLQTENKIFPC